MSGLRARFKNIYGKHGKILNIFCNYYLNKLQLLWVGKFIPKLPETKFGSSCWVYKLVSFVSESWLKFRNNSYKVSIGICLFVYLCRCICDIFLPSDDIAKITEKRSVSLIMKGQALVRNGCSNTLRNRETNPNFCKFTISEIIFSK